MTLKVKKGDKVLVIAGKDRGKQGKVLKVFPKKERITVEGVNLVKKHARPTQKNPEGGIIEIPASIHVSNVMVVCPGCGEATRVGRRDLDGKRVRYCKKCGQDIDKS